MPVQPWVTGPNYIFLGRSLIEPEFSPGEVAAGVTNPDPLGFKITNDKPDYLGTATHCPKPTIERAWKGIPSSAAGLMIDSEFAYMGEEAHIYMVLSRWNELVYEKYTNQFQNVNIGILEYVDIGGLLIAQQVGLTLSIVFPYEGTYKGMPAGYRFLNVMMTQDDLLEEGGNEPRQLGLHFHATSVYDDKSDIWTLYDFSVPAAPAVK